jgi:hypothetical protein
MYVFVDEWRFPAPVEAVYEILSCPREYPVWWGDVFLHGEGDPGPAAPGKRVLLETRGRLPYRLRWELVCVEAHAPFRLVSYIQGTSSATASGRWPRSTRARWSCSNGESRCASRSSGT